MEMNLMQKQSLKLAMTQELRQAITMLQFNAQELTDFLFEQSLENPLIEVETPYNDYTSSKVKQQTTSSGQGMELYTRRTETLQEELVSQLNELKIDNEEYKIIKYLIYNLDKNGFLMESDEELIHELNISFVQLQICIDTLQRFEPSGVGARSVKECLLIQLNGLEVDTTIAKQVLKDYFDLFVNKNWKEIAKKLKISLPDLQKEIDLILTLQPRPGLNYFQDQVNYVAPDLTVEKIGGEFVVLINDKIMPRLKVLNEYSSILNGQHEKEVSTYLKDKNTQVNWLMKSLEERKSTMLAVMNCILRKQIAFFEKGPANLKTLTLKEIAEELSLHESTISRTCKNKYVQTPFGLYEMKKFFHQGVSVDGEELASTSVQVFIKQLVDGENKEKPLSDQKLVELLAEKHGVEISRRTVAKYRDILRIPGSSKRKRFS
ncbi:MULTISPECIES: RNA polymerase factor sigma-54 [Bacillaceae]|uniref:RNA polymerase factor sigma-54 n=1 Tax=Bacillaceae TaxID=186817 RepID=UPI000BEDDA27|nr:MULTISPECIES: RNA polymerase factor sigma-54 [unclassified Bacillus (in: firmicutes)]PEC51664.1 RNA polymerase sigma-54 factor [Bacillus sp. AFS096315]PFM81794.1 RNA polymerase sigma-54 factor [Bacillus sp. AFS077874]